MEPYQATLMGFGLVVLGLIAVAVSAFYYTEKPRTAVASFTGPFGSDKKMMVWLAGLGFVVLTAVTILVNFWR